MQSRLTRWNISAACDPQGFKNRPLEAALLASLGLPGGVRSPATHSRGPFLRTLRRSKAISLLFHLLWSCLLCQKELRASMYSEIQRERADIGGLMARPEYRDWNPELIKPKKLLNPVKASRSHQELHRELLMNHRRGLGVDSKPELQRVLEHRRRNQLIKKKKEELEAKRLQCPFEQELLRRQQRLNQLEKPPEKEEDHAPEFIKVRENLRRITTLTSEEKVL
ncbi:actin-associated protein FAM107A isoform X1 [Pteropus medius]|uniref:actin-associated protein FAM107A isoform X1 n=2 Tax=Pteropus vampyrus TaxID=132908 RepID=UPI00196AA9B0|nr:actin-associated protein FAM107A isoform X1 [Pteropus giganteus]